MTSSTNHPLKLTPKELEFPAISSLVQKTFRVDNLSDQHVLFRIKTTAPKRYTVRPNRGSIGPNSHVVIKVSMNLSKEPQQDPEKKDKFQIQCTFLGDQEKKPPNMEDKEYLKNAWNEAIFGNKEMFKQRIKVTIVPDTSSNTESKSVESRGEIQSPPSTVSPSSNHTSTMSSVPPVFGMATGKTWMTAKEPVERTLTSGTQPVTPGRDMGSTGGGASSIIGVRSRSKQTDGPDTEYGGLSDLDLLKKERDLLRRQCSDMRTNRVLLRTKVSVTIQLLVAFLLGLILAIYIF